MVVIIMAVGALTSTIVAVEALVGVVIVVFPAMVAIRMSYR